MTDLMTPRKRPRSSSPLGPFGSPQPPPRDTVSQPRTRSGLHETVWKKR